MNEWVNEWDKIAKLKEKEINFKCLESLFMWNVFFKMSISIVMGFSLWFRSRILLF